MDEKLDMTKEEILQEVEDFEIIKDELEKLNRTPQITTLIKLLYPLGYTLKVVPINHNEKITN